MKRVYHKRFENLTNRQKRNRIQVDQGDITSLSDSSLPRVELVDDISSFRSNFDDFIESVAYSESSVASSDYETIDANSTFPDLQECEISSDDSSTVNDIFGSENTFAKNLAKCFLVINLTAVQGALMKKSKISGTDRKGRNIYIPAKYCSSSEENTTTKMINDRPDNINMEYEIGKMVSSLNCAPSAYTNSAESSAPSTIASETPPQSNVSYPSNIEPLHNYNSTQYSNPKQHSNSMHSPQYTNMNTVPALSGYAPPFPYHHHGSPNNNGQIDDFLKTMLDAIEKVGTAVYAIRDEINKRLDGFEKRIFENVNKLRKDLLQRMVDRNAQQPHQSYKPPNGFPLRTLEQLDAFLQNADQIQNLKLYLSSVGGGTVKETLNQFLKETLHEELVTNFTWIRAEGTRSMYNSKMAEIYFDGLVLCNRRVGSREFAQTMQEVLRIAKQRGRDKKRRERLPLGPRQQIEREIEQRYGRGQQIVFQRNNEREDSNEENNNSDSNSEN
ncbi:uncharacterized protein [Linepithema humile]|uniref:uncharacterized protein isoform X4 n=1 Tax=Linepithema humile TaxID=83485 RepID=UPI00351F7E54